MTPNITPYDHDHESEIMLFAQTNFRNSVRKFGIKTDDRRRHIYVIGKTGMGKTTLLENMVVHDINSGHGVCYIDPHGDTAARFLDFIPPSRINDVVYFNPADEDFPVGFNVLETSGSAKEKNLVSQGLMGVFKKIWGPEVFSARMEYIMLNTVLALLDAPGSTLLGINRIYVDDDYRKRVVSLIQDPSVKAFWVKEFASWEPKYRTEAVAAIQNKVGQFLSSAIIRNIVAQVKSTINVRDIMDNRKILICNLAKGMVGEEASRLLGAMLITRLQLAAMERVDIPKESDRQDFYLYVDEFQNFATESFASILSEARKYRLNLIVAHQYIAQLDEKVAAAIFGNVGTIITFRVGAEDAVAMENEFTPLFTPQDLVSLRKYDIYLKLMIDGAASQPFSATTLPQISQNTGSHERVIKVSRERYATPRQKIEEKVLQWSGIMGASGEAPAAAHMFGEDEEGSTILSERIKTLESSSPKIAEYVKPSGGGKKTAPDAPKFEIPCAVCGKISSVSFEPDWSRPWLCKEHQEMKKAGLLPSVPNKPAGASMNPPMPITPKPSITALSSAPTPTPTPAPQASQQSAPAPRPPMPMQPRPPMSQTQQPRPSVPTQNPPGSIVARSRPKDIVPPTVKPISLSSLSETKPREAPPKRPTETLRPMQSQQQSPAPRPQMQHPPQPQQPPSPPKPPEHKDQGGTLKPGEIQKL